MKPAPFSYQRCATQADAIRSLAAQDGHALVIAGGQSLGPMLNLRLAQPKQVIDVSRIEDMRGATLQGDVIAIGAAVTHAEIEDGKIDDVTGGLMPHVARGIAYRAVRNRGTIGGSLAHADPAADWATTMIALDASLRLSGPNGRREIKVGDFITGAMQTAIGDGEIITEVLVPSLSPAAHWGHAKYAKKPGDFAQSMAVAVVDPKRGLNRIVLGRRAEPPALLPALCKLLSAKGRELAAADHHTAIETDLYALSVDPCDLTMHHAIIDRAVLDLLR